MGKASSCLFFSRVNNRSSSAFELVHSDIWGPSRVFSVKSFRYFLIFINDFSRMTWLYLLKEMFEVSGVIKLFSVQFFTSIRVLCTDNALEYMKNDVSLLCFKNGIIHQTSCPLTSQQNGVAERKYTHILDVARTMVFICIF